jgi:hypothetical protein
MYKFIQPYSNFFFLKVVNQVVRLCRVGHAFGLRHHITLPEYVPPSNKPQKITTGLQSKLSRIWSQSSMELGNGHEFYVNNVE